MLTNLDSHLINFLRRSVGNGKHKHRAGNRIRDSKIVALGFDEKFIRTWKYYFEYCPAGFKSSTLGVYQVFRDIISRLLSLDSSKDWRTYTKDWWTYTMLVELLDQSWWLFACFGLIW
ncbi:hypothetical protein I3842_04G145600 [Carya illinoinensis]|uniref:Uncharacterized protein n=1 Tax=Carya illinoinensis TaxID=32201 RepID=A0A922JS00_CARIL|nr:hypothetical protein I3842_04G145600 [Carya illinoinensis]